MSCSTHEWDVLIFPDWNLDTCALNRHVFIHKDKTVLLYVKQLTLYTAASRLCNDESYNVVSLWGIYQTTVLISPLFKSDKNIQSSAEIK